MTSLYFLLSVSTTLSPSPLIKSIFPSCFSLFKPPSLLLHPFFLSVTDPFFLLLTQWLGCPVTHGSLVALFASQPPLSSLGLACSSRTTARPHPSSTPAPAARRGHASQGAHERAQSEREGEGERKREGGERKKEGGKLWGHSTVRSTDM